MQARSWLKLLSHQPVRITLASLSRGAITSDGHHCTPTVQVRMMHLDLARACGRTCAIVLQARGSSDPMAQQLARMTLAGLPRGGGDGDAIRHGILNVMRENGIREGHRPVSCLLYTLLPPVHLLSFLVAVTLT